jgi:hypothetical protein
MSWHKSSRNKKAATGAGQREQRRRLREQRRLGEQRERERERGGLTARAIVLLALPRRGRLQSFK